MTDHPFLKILQDAGLWDPPERAARRAAPGANGHPSAPVNPSDPRGSGYAAAALATECDRVAGTPEGGRNHALNTASFRLGRLVALGWAAEGAVEDALLAAAHACGLPTMEALSTIRSGLQAGQAHPREDVVFTGGQALPAAYTVELPATVPVPVPVPEAAEADSGLPKPLDWAALFAEADDDEPDWLVPDILERGRSHVLYAPHKVGKSLLTQCLCGDLAGDPVTTLYLDLENSRADIRERFRAMGYTPAQLARLHYFSFPSLAMLDTPLGGAQLAALVEHHQADLVVLDTTARVVAGDENDADTYRALYRYALIPLKAAGVTVLRLDHAGKDPTAGQRGSSAKGDDVDVVWLLLRHDGEHYTLKCDAQRSGHHPPTIGLVKQAEPLRFLRTDAGADPPAIAAVVAELERLQVPLDASRRAAHAQLLAAGIRVGNGPLSSALRSRRDRSTSWEKWSRTTPEKLILPKINNSGPQDQLQFPVSAGPTGPGPVADHGDHAAGAPLLPLVPPRWSLVGDQRGPAGPGPVPDRRPPTARVAGAMPPGEYWRAVAGHPEPATGDPARPYRCQRCHSPAERLIPGPRGRWVCPVCAYPNPADRPGHPEEETE